ncbi:MAG: ParB/RepB/Spo0J family partition protein [Campylobacterales bacterium]|nr:ParB/RepB/Spo0J family partition protein [Campylobacterales bacterium]
MAKEALGRGLGALLGEIEEAYANEMPQKRGDIKEIALGDIRPNPYQPRKTFDPEGLAELADSIRDHGLLQPIIVVRDGDRFTLVAGERRWRACKLAKTKTIKAIVVSITQEQMREHALIENIQRESLNIIELAQAYEELIKMHDLTHEQLAQTLHKSRTHITNTLRLLQLNKKVQKALLDEAITMGHAKVMIGLSDKDQIVMTNSIIGQKLSVRDVESMVKSIKEPSSESKKEVSVMVMLDLAKMRERINMFGFTCKAQGSKLTIDFKDQAEVERFLALVES